MLEKKEWEIINQSNDEYIENQEKKKRTVKKLLDAVIANDKDKIMKLKKEISLSEVYEENITALALATKNNNVDLIGFLIEQGASISTLFAGGKDVAWLAVENGNPNLFKYFLKKGILLNLKYGEHTRLIQAVEMSDVQTVKNLLNYGINIHEKDNQGRTALHYNFNKSPYTEQDKQIGVLLTAVGLDPSEQDLNEIPAYGYLDDIDSIKNFYDVSKLPDLPNYKVQRVEKIKEKERVKDGIIAKYDDVNKITKTTIKKPKSFKSYYMPKTATPQRKPK